MDVISGTHVPLFNILHSFLSSVPPSPLLLYNGYSDGYLDELNSNMDFLNNELDSDAIKAL